MDTILKSEPSDDPSQIVAEETQFLKDLEAAMAPAAAQAQQSAQQRLRSFHAQIAQQIRDRASLPCAGSSEGLCLSAR